MSIQLIYPVKHYITGSDVPLITSRFGEYRGNGYYHEGLDMAAYKGQEVVASAAGVVVRHYPTWQVGGHPYGVYLWLDHGDGYWTCYAHNDRLLVNLGQEVKQGQPIALADSTGNSTGNHCHLNLTYNQKYLDPEKYIVGTIPAIPPDATATYIHTEAQNVRKTPAVVNGNILVLLAANTLVYVTGKSQEDAQGYKFLEIASGQTHKGFAIGGAWIAERQTVCKVTTYGKVGLLI